MAEMRTWTLRDLLWAAVPKKSALGMIAILAMVVWLRTSRENAPNLSSEMWGWLTAIIITSAILFQFLVDAKPIAFAARAAGCYAIAALLCWILVDKFHFSSLWLDVTGYDLLARMPALGGLALFLFLVQLRHVENEGIGSLHGWLALNSRLQSRRSLIVAVLFALIAAGAAIYGGLLPALHGRGHALAAFAIVPGVAVLSLAYGLTFPVAYRMPTSLGTKLALTSVSIPFYVDLLMRSLFLGEYLGGHNIGLAIAVTMIGLPTILVVLLINTVLCTKTHRRCKIAH